MFLMKIKSLHPRVAASDRKSVESPLIWYRRKPFWPKIHFNSESGSKKF